MRKVLILESDRDQAKTIAGYLRKYTDFNLYYEKGVEADKYDGYDIVIPTGATSTLYYAKKNGKITLGNITYTQDNLITFDKIRTLKLVKSIGVPIPETFTDKTAITEFPIFYKSLREEGYNERGIIRNKVDLDKLTSNTVFYQEFINTQGTFAVGFISDRGKIITDFIQEEKVSYPRHGGSGVVLERIENERLREYTARIVKAVNYSGWGLVEYKYCDIRDDFVFMEVNGKFWASIEFAFLNNNIFLKEMFDINYKPKDIKRVVYIDRVLASNFSEIKKSIPYLTKAKIIRKQSLLKVLRKRLF